MLSLATFARRALRPFALAPARATPARSMATTELRMRLQRFGYRAHPFFRVVVTHAWRKRDGYHLERVGTWDPLPHKDGVKEIRLNFERIKYWISVGVKPTRRVEWILGMANLLPLVPRKDGSHKSVPKSERLERPARTARKQERTKLRAMVQNARKLRLLARRRRENGEIEDATKLRLLARAETAKIWGVVHGKEAAAREARASALAADADPAL